MKTSTFISQRRSPLMQAMSIKKGDAKPHAKDMSPALPLTSLIDAFCIIVIYLLIGTQTTGVETPLPGKLNLPNAEYSQAVDKEVATLRIEKGSYFLNEKPVAKTALGEKLSALKKQSTETVELMVQADTQMEYADLDPLLRAGSEAGIEKLRFAVIPK